MITPDEVRKISSKYAKRICTPEVAQEMIDRFVEEHKKTEVFPSLSGMFRYLLTVMISLDCTNSKPHPVDEHIKVIEKPKKEK